MATKKASPAQIAARQLFAARAKAGEFSKRPGVAAKRKAARGPMSRVDAAEAGLRLAKKHAARRKANPANPTNATARPSERPNWKVHDTTREKEYVFLSEAGAIREAKDLVKFDIVGDVYENTAKRGANKWVKRFWFDSTGVYPMGSWGQAHTRLPNPLRVDAALKKKYARKSNPITPTAKIRVEALNNKTGKWRVIAKFFHAAEAKSYAHSVARSNATIAVRVVS